MVLTYYTIVFVIGVGIGYIVYIAINFYKDVTKRVNKCYISVIKKLIIGLKVKGLTIKVLLSVLDYLTRVFVKVFIIGIKPFLLNFTVYLLFINIAETGSAALLILLILKCGVLILTIGGK